MLVLITVLVVRNFEYKKGSHSNLINKLLSISSLHKTAKTISKCT